MTPKEKALELLNQYADIFINDEDEFYVGTVSRITKQCALVAVGEVLDKDGYNNHYWREVKQEIEKL